MTDVLEPGVDEPARTDAALDDPRHQADAAEGPQEPRSSLSRVRTIRCVAIIAVGAAIWAAAGSLWLFPLLTDNADEGAYLSQSAALRAGEILPPAPDAHTLAYHPWFSAIRDGSFVYKYTPVHAGFIALAHTLFSTDRALLVLVALADVVLLALLARELGASRGAAALACLVFALSPLWIIQSASFLPYAANLVFLQGFLLLLLRGMRLRSAVLVACAGLVAGVAVFARPFDSLLFVSLAFAWQLWTRRRERVLALTGWFALGLVPAAALFLAYNAVATGNLFKIPFHVTGSSDTLGFGSRQVLPNDWAVDYTVGKAISALMNNMKLVITWTFGGFVTLVLTAYGFASHRELRGRAFLALLLVVWPLGFFFFWGAYASVLLWGITQYVGPFYYMPMLMALSIGAGVGITRLFRDRAWLGTLALVALAGITLFTLLPALHTNEERTAQHEVVHDAVAKLDSAGPSLLFLPPLYGPYLQNPFSFLRNAPHYDGHTVYALDDGNRDFDLIDEYPARTPYVLSVPTGYGGDRPAETTKAFTQRQRLVTTSSITVTARVSPILRQSQAGLLVILGATSVEIHFTDDGNGGGVTTFAVTRTADGRVVLTDGNDPSATTITRDVNSPLYVGVHTESSNGSVVYGRLIPMRSDDRGFELLLPGTVTNDQLGMFESATISVEPAR